MAMSENNKQENPLMDPRNRDDLTRAMALIDRTVDKKYVTSIETLSILCPDYEVVEEYDSDDENEDEIIEKSESNSENGDSKCINKLFMGENVQLTELTRFVYEEDESVQDKLVSVYQAVSSYENAKIFMLIRSNAKEQKIYLGVSSNQTQESSLLNKQLIALKENFYGNFPGTTFKDFKNIEGENGEKGISTKQQIVALLQDVFGNNKNIAAISGIPSLKSEKRNDNKQFIQGIEKAMDAIVGKTVDILVLAEPITADELNSIKNGYQEIYSNISPFAKSVINVSNTNSDSVTETLTKGVTESTNESVAKTHSHTLTQGKNSSHSVGGHAGVQLKLGKEGPGGELGGDYHYTWGIHNDTSDSDGETITEGISNALSEQNSVANGLTSSHSDGLQIESENKSIKCILEKIDKQLERIRKCEDYGMYDCGVYVLSSDYATTISASVSFKSIMRGEDSSTEASFINSWQQNNKDKSTIEHILTYLKEFNHPVFALKIGNHEKSDVFLPVTPTTIISGHELAIQMGMPRKSVSSIAVIKTARFGRNVLYVDETVKACQEIVLGNIYHMNKNETAEVTLNVESLPSHVFITGSTGSGKSTTVYKLLDEVINKNNKYHFMVIEPAKGEYKNVFGGLKGVEVYGTNLYEVENLLKINPFKFPEEKIHVLEHIDKLIGIFNACWPMYAAMPAILKDAIEKAYLAAGWDLTTSKCIYKSAEQESIFPGFSDVLTQINSVLKESKYSDDSKSDYTGALVTRLASLTNGINGLVFTTNETSGKDLFEKNVIIDLSRVSGDETKSLIMGMLIIKQQEYRLANRNGMNESLKHITVLEEAHNILKRTSTEQTSEGTNLVGKSVEMISSAIAEMRTYGESFFIVDQSPSSVDPSAIRNTNTKIIMRLPDVSDRDQIGKSIGLTDEQISELAKLKTGVAVVYQNNWVDAVLCQVDKDGIKQQPYTLPEKYEADWNGDEKVVKEIVDIVLEPFIENRRKVITTDFIKQALNTGLSADTKVKLLKYHNCDNHDTRAKLAEDIIYGLLFNDEVWNKSLIFKDDIQVWQSMMESRIKPDISDMEKEAVDVILQILAYKQGMMYKENNQSNAVEAAEMILSDLMKNSNVRY